MCWIPTEQQDFAVIMLKMMTLQSEHMLVVGVHYERHGYTETLFLCIEKDATPGDFGVFMCSVLAR